MRADAQLCAVRPCSRAEPTRSRRTDAAHRRAAHRRDVQAKLVVAKVKEVGFVENSDKLYLCQVQVGPDEVRQVVTGLRKHVPQEVLEGATVMTIINLKTAKLAGQLSAAMIMCGVTDGKVTLAAPPAGATVGDRIFVGGAEPKAPPPKEVRVRAAAELLLDRLRRCRRRCRRLPPPPPLRPSRARPPARVCVRAARRRGVCNDENASLYSCRTTVWIHTCYITIFRLKQTPPPPVRGHHTPIVERTLADTG